MKIKKLIKRIKTAWSALTSDNTVFLAIDSNGKKLEEKDIFFSALCQLSREYFSCIFDDFDVYFSRLEMMDSVLGDPSVILQSIHDGEPTFIYDCASEDDFQLLLSQDIENVKDQDNG